jgi:hypothetical protein
MTRWLCHLVCSTARTAHLSVIEAHTWVCCLPVQTVSATTVVVIMMFIVGVILVIDYRQRRYCCGPRPLRTDNESHIAPCTEADLL